MRVTKVNPKKSNLALPQGHWQLYSYGRLTQVPTAKQAIWIRAYLRRVELDEYRRIKFWSRETEVRDLPVGELVAWEVGCIFDPATERVHRPQPIADGMEVLDVDVTFNKDNCSFVRRYEQDESGYYTIAHRPGIFPEEEDANICFLRAKTDSDGPDLLIPSVTILQAFWGRSSNIIHMLLDGRFLEFDKYVINMAKSSLDQENRTAYLWLRQWSLNNDVKFLATIAFDDEAVLRGKRIGLQLHAEADYIGNEPQRHMAVLPPCQTPMRLKLLARRQKTEKGTVLYVQRILKIENSREFDKLIYGRDNDGRPYEQDPFDPQKKNTELKPMERARTGRPRDQATSQYSLGQDHPDFNSTSKETEIGSFDNINATVNEIEVEPFEPGECTHENVMEVEAYDDARWWKLLSTLPSSSTSSEKALRTVLSSAQALFDEPDTSPDEIGPYLDDMLATVINLNYKNIKDLRPDDVEKLEIEPAFPWRPSPVLDSKWVFSLPFEFDDRTWAWLYRDPDQEKRKRGLCLKITFHEKRGTVKVGYIVDIEARKTKIRKKRNENSENFSNTAIILIWQEIGANSNIPLGIANIDLRSLIISVLKNNAQRTRDIAGARGLRTTNKNHSAQGVDFFSLIEKLYSSFN